MSKYFSKKMIVALLYPVLLAVNTALNNPFTDDQLMYAAGLFAVYILAQFGIDRELAKQSTITDKQKAECIVVNDPLDADLSNVRLEYQEKPLREESYGTITDSLIIKRLKSDLEESHIENERIANHLRNTEKLLTKHIAKLESYKERNEQLNTLNEGLMKENDRLRVSDIIDSARIKSADDSALPDELDFLYPELKKEVIELAEKEGIEPVEYMKKLWGVVKSECEANDLTLSAAIECAYCHSPLGDEYVSVGDLGSEIDDRRFCDDGCHGNWSARNR